MDKLPAMAWFGWWMVDKDGTLETCCSVEEPCTIHSDDPALNWFDHPDCRVPVGAQVEE
jgi:hypothetical protein